MSLAEYLQLDIKQRKINFKIPSSVQLSHSVVSDSLQSHELQHTRPPCPSPTPRVYPNPCPLSQWCHPTISSSVVPFSSYPQSFLASGLFKWVSSSHQVAKVLFNISPTNEHPGLISFRMNWLNLLASPRDYQEASPTPQFKSINSSVLSFIVQFSHPYMTIGETIALTRQTFVDK